jgi:MFS family permease
MAFARQSYNRYEEHPSMKAILPTIVIAQFFCTSLWFAGNAIMPDMVGEFHLPNSFLAHITSAVQLGFITGTLLFALLAIADRFPPSRVFFASAVIAALFNLAIVLVPISSGSLMIFRFLTGFFLAGIYPVGMKIAADHYQQSLGKSLGFLVGALVLGTAFPHLLKSLTAKLPWTYVVYCTSALSVTGGLILLLLVPNGPYRKKGQPLKLSSFLDAFKGKEFRLAAFGYFGHMWELYAFWAFLPVMLNGYQAHHRQVHLNIPLCSFAIIAAGSLACVSSGFLSQRFGPKKLATVSLFLSCCCCLLSPLFLLAAPVNAFMGFLFFWGLVVIADSPMFSTLVASHAPAASRGTALTLVNCIGFSITIASIQFIHALSKSMDGGYLYMLLAIGPILGLFALRQNKVD